MRSCAPFWITTFLLLVNNPWSYVECSHLVTIAGIRGNIHHPVTHHNPHVSCQSPASEQTVSSIARMKSLLVPAGLLVLSLLGPGLCDPQFGLGPFGAHFGAPGPFLPPRPASPPTLQFQIPPGRLYLFPSILYFSMYLLSAHQARAAWPALCSTPWP